MQLNIYPINISFDYYKNNSSIIDKSLTDTGAQLLDKKTTNYGSKEYLYYELSLNNQNEVVLFTNMNDGNTIRFEVMNPGENLSTAMEATNYIASSSTKNTSNQSLNN